MVAEMSGWGTPLPDGWARGIAIDDRRSDRRKPDVCTICAVVCTVSVSKKGQVRLERVDVAFDEGFGFVNPLSVRRMDEYPRQVNIRFFKTNHWLTGVGEEAMAQIPPAIVNAVFKVTGKRVRNLPMRNHDLSWA